MSQEEDDLILVANEWDQAMVRNDADAIGRYMADDWIIVGADGSMSDKATFLGLVKSGALSHDVMESENFSIRIYGSTAVVMARGISGGSYNGQAFREAEQSSNVFVKQHGRWKCVLTHLSRIQEQHADLGRPWMVRVLMGLRAVPALLATVVRRRRLNPAREKTVGRVPSR